MNEGKLFESHFKKCVSELDKHLIIRIPDQQSGYKGSYNIADFLVYNGYTLTLVECKTVADGRFALSNVNPNQLNDMCNFTKIVPNLKCLYVIFFREPKITKVFTCDDVKTFIDLGNKSIFSDDRHKARVLVGKENKKYIKYSSDDLIDLFK